MFFTILKVVAFVGAAIVGGIAAYNAANNNTNYGSHSFVRQAPSIGYAQNNAPTYAYGLPQNQYCESTNNGTVVCEGQVYDLNATIDAIVREVRRQAALIEQIKAVVTEVVKACRQASIPVQDPAPITMQEPVPVIEAAPVVVEPEYQAPIMPMVPVTSSIRSDWDIEGDHAIIVMQQREQERMMNPTQSIIASPTVMNAVNYAYQFDVNRRFNQYYDSDMHRQMMADRYSPRFDYHDAFGGDIPMDRLRIDPPCVQAVIDVPYQPVPDTAPDPVKNNNSFHFCTNW